MTQTDWATKESQIQENFVWGIGPEALYQMTRAEYKNEPEKMAIKDLIRVFQRMFFTKKHIPQTGRILLDQTKRSRDTGRFLAETDRNRNVSLKV